MGKKAKKSHKSGLFFRIICTVIAGILCLVTALCILNVRLSKEVFLEMYSESQEKIFNQIDSDFFEFYRDLSSVMEKVALSDSVRNYMTDHFANQIEDRGYALAMEKVIRNSEFSNYTDLNMLLVSRAGKTYIYNGSDKMSTPVPEILSSDIVRDALNNPRVLVSRYRKNGFTDIMENDPVIIFAKAFRNPQNDVAEGAIIVTIKEEDFQKMYSYFTSDYSNILIYNQDQELLSASDHDYFSGEKAEAAEKILNELEEKSVKSMTVRQAGKTEAYQIQRFHNTSYKILGILNPEQAFEERYNLEEVLLITVLITLSVAYVIYRFVRSQTRPLYQLADTMSKVGEGNLEEYAEIEGTEEIRQLSETYNKMINDINHYISEIYRAESEKRSAEIHALQMQINPHYMYNTLTSIKWLAWQGDMNKTTKVIDAFISLLRNTISNTEGFILVEQEIENLKNYVLINQVRYGDNVNVEYFIAMDCNQYKVPKLILQPFVENAFFHAFPEGKKGSIQVFARRDKDCLRFDIIDNGIGIEKKKLQLLQKKEGQKGEHFTGIGVENVDDRIKMIYGKDYGIKILSEEKRGTTITILLPADMKKI